MSSIDSLKQIKIDPKIQQQVQQKIIVEGQDKLTNSKTSEKVSKVKQNITKTISKLDEINTTINDVSLGTTGKPFNLVQTAKNLITEVSKPSTPSQAAKDKNPLKTKVTKVGTQAVNGVIDTFLKSESIIPILEKNINSLIGQSQLNYIKTENGKITAQPIRSAEVDAQLENINKITQSLTKTTNVYMRRVYNSDPITNTKDLQNNISLNKVIDFLQMIASIYSTIIQIKIIARKIQDVTASVNANLTAPPQPAVSARFAQQALEYTSNEQKQLDNIAGVSEYLDSIHKKITLYGNEYEKIINKINGLQNTIDTYYSGVTNNALSNANNSISGSISEYNSQLEKSKI